MKNFRVRKLGVLLMTLCLAVALLSTGAFAGVTAEIDGVSYNFSTIPIYKTNVQLFFDEFSADGDFIKSHETVIVSREVAPDDAAVAAAVADEVAAMEADYTVTKTDETTQAQFSSQYVLDDEGNVRIFDNLDDLVAAFIASGDVSHNLTFNWVTTITQEYKVVRKGAVGSAVVSGVSISGLDAPVAGAAPDTACTITTDPAGGVEAYEVSWVHVTTDANGGVVYDWDWTGNFQENEYYYARIYIALKDGFRAEFESGGEKGGPWKGTATAEGVQIDDALNSAMKYEIFLLTKNIKAVPAGTATPPAPSPSPVPSPAPSPKPAGPTSPATGVGDVTALWIALALSVTAAAVVLPRRKER